MADDTEEERSFLVPVGCIAGEFVEGFFLKHSSIFYPYSSSESHSVCTALLWTNTELSAFQTELQSLEALTS